jgi:serine/threonine protein kinase
VRADIFTAKSHDQYNCTHSISIYITEAAGCDLLMELLQFDPYRRPSAEQAMNHPYFANLNLQPMSN